MAHDEKAAGQQDWSRETQRQILAALAEIRFGSVEILIHDGKIVQVERKEKIRFSS